MVKRAYLQCSHGHYFRTPQCPFDGLHSPASAELQAAMHELGSRAREPTLDALRKVGVSEVTLRRITVVDFLDEAEAWEGMRPEGYIVAGEWRPTMRSGPAAPRSEFAPRPAAPADSAMVRVYSHCTHAHYFEGRTCPIDGWTSPASSVVAEVSQRLIKQRRELSASTLRNGGASAAALEGALIIEFGDPQSSFQAVALKDVVRNYHQPSLNELLEQMRSAGLTNVRIRHGEHVPPDR